MKVVVLGDPSHPAVAVLRACREVEIAPDEAQVVVAIGSAPVEGRASALPRLQLGGDRPSDPGVVWLPLDPLTPPIIEVALRAARPPATSPFAVLFGASPIGLALTTPDGVVSESNGALASLLGCAPEEVAGRATTSFCELEPAEGEPGARRARLVRRDGTRRHAVVSSAELRDRPDGPVTALLRTFVDVSDQLESREFLERTLHHLPAGVLVVGCPEGQTILANEAARELFGDEALAEPTAARRVARLDLQREDGTAYPLDELPLIRTLRDGGSYKADDLWVSRKGLRFPVSARSAAIPWQGRGAAILVLQDETPLREQERQRRAAEKRYLALFEQTRDGILIATDDGAIVEANGAALRLFGRDRERLSGTSFVQLAPADQGDGAPSRVVFARELERARRAGVARFPWRGQRGGASIDLEVTLQPIRLEGAPDLVIVQARDVTQQRILEEELRQSQKLEAIGVLAGGVAHEYNNLLTGVIGFLELALERVPEGQPVQPNVSAQLRRFLGEARRAAHRSVELTRQLLTFSRRSKANPKPMDLNESIERSAAMIRKLVGETVRFELRLAPGGCPVRGDPGHLDQAIMNLVINARDAMPQGGTLAIETGRRTVGSEAGDLAPGEYVELVVTDTGAGMSDSVRSRIFEPFYTTKEKGRGTGLGLAVVHGIVQRHAGKIHVESAPGSGSRFTILLPLATDPVPRGPATASISSGALLRGTGDVLVVDDDPMVREVTAAMLEALGYRVRTVGSAAEALAQVAASCPDLVVSDVVMPDVNGIELERRLRRERPDLKVLLVSGYARDAFERQGIDESAAPALLKKPLTLESLGAKVRDLLSG